MSTSGESTPWMPTPVAENARFATVDIVRGIAPLIISPIWLRAYQFGPLEWLWRTLTYGKRQPFVRRAAATPAAVTSKAA